MARGTTSAAAGAMRPFDIVHEHANLTDTPGSKMATARRPARHRDRGVAETRFRHTHDGFRKEVKVVYLGVPLEEFSASARAPRFVLARGAWPRLATPRCGRDASCKTQRGISISRCCALV